MNELIPVSYHCGFCGELNETLVDPTGGDRQIYIEDCTVCCRPNSLRISILPEGGISLEVESEA